MMDQQISSKFRNTIQIGIGASEELLKADGDILFATPTVSLLFSGHDVFLNGALQHGVSGEAVKACASVLKSMLYGADRLSR